MKYAYILLISLIIACNSSEQKANTGKAPAAPVAIKTDYLLEPNSINSLLKSNHSKLTGISGNFEAFKKYLDQLSDKDVASIAYAMDYINTCLAPDIAERDSIVLLFNVKFFKIVNDLSGNLETKYPQFIVQLEKDAVSNQLKTFKDNLNQCGIGIFSTEGNYYLDVQPDYFYDNFKGRVSDGVKTYLDIRRHELAEGFSEDAGLLISYKQVGQRVKTWEKYLAYFPDNVYSAEAEGYYSTYLETLLTGMDNSPVFESDTNLIDPEIKTVYEGLMQNEQNSKSGKLIGDYYRMLARHEFKTNDSVAVFLKEHKLSSMAAVQPDTR